MKKQKVLYGFLIAGCVFEYMILSAFTILIKMPIELIACINVASAGITMVILYCLINKFNKLSKADRKVPQSDCSDSLNYSIGVLVEERLELLENLEKANKEAKLLHQELQNHYKNAEQIKRQNQMLVGWIENFPFEISPQFKLYNLIETEIVTGSYSRWLIPGEENGMLFAIEIVRPDNQNKIELFQMLQNVKNKEDILNLDMAKEMFNPELQCA